MDAEKDGRETRDRAHIDTYVRSVPSLMVGNRYSSYHQTGDKDVFLDEVPVRVSNIHFDGLDRTKNDVLKKISQDLLKATNFQDMVIKAQEVKHRLNNLSAFNGIGVVVDSNKENEFSYDITFHVIEKSRVTGTINTTFGTHENSGSVITGIQCPNLHGRGESFNLNYSYGSKSFSGFDVLINKPLAPWTTRNPNLILSAFQKGFNNPWTGLNEINRGSYVGVTAKLSDYISSNIFINSIISTLSASNMETPFLARLESGHYLKTSVTSNITFDTRNNTSMPTYGNLVKLSNELAGLSKIGSVNFLKNEVELQSNVNFLNGLLIFQSTLKAGLINDLNYNCHPKLIITDNTRVPINERFNLGGPLNLRGYCINGVGPHDSFAALGGNAYWVYGAHIYTPLPFARHIRDIIRAHVFFNSGSIESINFGANSNGQGLIEQLSKNVRKSVGIGIVVSFGIVRLELNYALPIVGPNGFGQDRIDQGIQFGIGATFT